MRSQLRPNEHHIVTWKRRCDSESYGWWHGFSDRKLPRLWVKLTSSTSSRHNVLQWGWSGWPEFELLPCQCYMCDLGQATSSLWTWIFTAGKWEQFYSPHSVVVRSKSSDTCKTLAHISSSVHVRTSPNESIELWLWIGLIQATHHDPPSIVIFLLLSAVTSICIKYKSNFWTCASVMQAVDF